MTLTDVFQHCQKPDTLVMVFDEKTEVLLKMCEPQPFVFTTSENTPPEYQVPELKWSGDGKDGYIIGISFRVVAISEERKDSTCILFAKTNGALQLLTSSASCDVTVTLLTMADIPLYMNQLTTYGHRVADNYYKE